MTAADKHFWEAREQARHSLLGCILVIAIAVQCLDLSVVQTLCGAIVTMALLYVGYLSFATRSNEEKQKAFNLIICVISVVSASWFLMTVIMIYRGKIDEDKPAHAADRVVLWRIAGGGIPPLTILFTFIPLVATPAGFDIQLAKKVSAVTMVMFTVSAYFVANSPCPGHCTAQDKKDRQVATKIDFFFGILFYSMCLFSCVPGAQVGVEFISLLRNSQTGDNILNHILKNAISEAACLLEIEISAGGDKVDADPNIMPEVHSASNVARALKQLYRTMEWCASRQTYLNLAEGTYRSNLVSVDLKIFLSNLTKGSVPFSIEDHTDARLARDRSMIAFDEKMAHLALENAVRNATTHGDGSLVQLSATFRELRPPSNSPGTVNGELVLSVSNRIPSNARVSTQVLKKISKRDKMSSTITLASEASRPIEAGAHNREHQSARVPVKHFGSISTNSGLIHIGIAMEGAGGSYDIRTTPNSDGTSNFVIDIMLPAHMNQNRGGHNSFSETGPSLVAQSELPPPAQIEVTVPPKGGIAIFGPKCCAIDDSSIICKGYSKLLFPALEADLESSAVVCPRSHDDVAHFMAKVGQVTTGDAADICILDQNIDLKDTGDVVYGTALARDLRKGGFDGLIFIRSANSSETDVSTYFADGCIDGFFGKDESYNAIASKIKLQFKSKPLGIFESIL